MKFIVTALTLIGSNAFAINFSRGERSDWIEKISTSCQKSFLRHHGRNKSELATKACDCAAENFVMIGERETNIKSATDQLNWINLYYSMRLSQQEIDQDPFFLDHYLFAIGDGCLNSPTFKQ